MTLARRSRRSRLTATSAVGLMAVAGAVATAAPAAADPACATVEALMDCVTVDGVEEHLEAFQEIATANGGNRASGSSGYTASADYVEERLEDAGYTVTRQPFDFDFYEVVGQPTLERTAPTSKTYVYGADFQDMSYSGSGSVDGAVVPVDIGSADSGCDAADFTGFTTGSVALIKRGSCDFAVKAANAEAAGASAAIIYNDGQSTPDEDRTTLIGGTLGGPVGIPVLDATFAAGQELAQSGTAVSIDIQTVNEVVSTENVIAELEGRTARDVIGVGAHLDSVPEGPGINDNGTGSAAILEVAEEMAGTQPENSVRFFWWGAEESGLVGSQHYVDSLSQGQVKKFSAYLNFDMVGSPNFARFVYDGDGSTFEAPEGYVTPESTAIEQLFESFYDARGLKYEDTEFDGRSDYEAFAVAGVPSGGLFTGAEGIKTEDQAARYGGTAGEAFDPCYHEACDTLANYNSVVLDQNADAIAYATATLANQQYRPGE
jgi:Zn-dependent M28 family amino/carboxypeptidase